jgi:hypothetical protein
MSKPIKEALLWIPEFQIVVALDMREQCPEWPEMGGRWAPIYANPTKRKPKGAITLVVKPEPARNAGPEPDATIRRARRRRRPHAA